MTHLLDTNICSAEFKRPCALAHRFMQHDPINDRIASSRSIEKEDREELRFNTIGGLRRVYHVFVDEVNAILDELNMRLAI